MAGIFAAKSEMIDLQIVSLPDAGRTSMIDDSLDSIALDSLDHSARDLPLPLLQFGNVAVFCRSLPSRLCPLPLCLNRIVL